MKELPADFRLIISALAMAFGLAGSLPTLAQTGATTSITGQVKDPQGQTSGLTVTLYSRERTASMTTTTDSTGTYRLENWHPENTWWEAAAQGFASANAGK